jgi:hypothetical protein
MLRISLARGNSQGRTHNEYKANYYTSFIFPSSELCSG